MTSGQLKKRAKTIAFKQLGYAEKPEGKRVKITWTDGVKPRQTPATYLAKAEDRKLKSFLGGDISTGKLGGEREKSAMGPGKVRTEGDCTGDWSEKLLGSWMSGEEGARKEGSSFQKNCGRSKN